MILSVRYFLELAILVYAILVISGLLTVRLLAAAFFVMAPRDSAERVLRCRSSLLLWGVAFLVAFALIYTAGRYYVRCDVSKNTNTVKLIL